MYLFSFLLGIAKSFPGVVATNFFSCLHWLAVPVFPHPHQHLVRLDFCQSNGCKVASKLLAFPSLRVKHLYVCLLAILVFSSLIFLFSYGLWLIFLLHLWILLHRSFEFNVRFINLFSYELCHVYLIYKIISQFNVIMIFLLILFFEVHVCCMSICVF